MVVSMKMAIFWVVAPMMEAASTSETLVNFYQTTWCNNPEDSHLLDIIKSLLLMILKCQFILQAVSMAVMVNILT
jgi:hypothetical protein